METNTTNRPTLTFDGKGINGPDIYRSRIATFAPGIAGEELKRYGTLFAAAPELADALIECCALLEFLEPEISGGFSPDGALAKGRLALLRLKTNS